MSMPREAATDPGSKTAAEIEREVRQSRARVEDTLDAIQQRLSPGQLLDQAVGYFRGGGGEFARNLSNTVIQNPIPVTLVGVGLAWMMLAGQSSGRNGDRPEPARWDDDYGYGYEPSASGAAAGETAQGLGEHAAEFGAAAREQVASARAAVEDQAQETKVRAQRYGRRATEYGRRARVSVVQTFSEQPLVLGAIGLAVGAALGTALPSSEAEDRLMGETGDEVRRRAKEAGRQQAEEARTAANAVVSAAREEADKQGLTPESARETPRSPTEPQS